MRLLLVEDHPGLREMMDAHLRRAGFTVDPFDRGEPALRAASTVDYDLALLDLGLPDLDGMDVLRRLRRTVAPELRIIVLTARDAVAERVEGLDAGADDYVVKPFELTELDARMRTVLRRAGTRASPIETFGDLRYEVERRSAFVDGRLLDLTRREASLLAELVRAEGRIVVRDALEERLYGFNERASANAIEAAVSRLRRRLAEAGSTTGIETSRGIGYRLVAGMRRR